jgi:site-specific DNA-cytosine methylase
LKRIQGFPDGYILKGPLDQQKKFIGNSVETGVVRAWMSAMANEAERQRAPIAQEEAA